MLLFLDIDGVMVPAKNWKSPEVLNDGFPAFTSKATHALQRLIADGSTIVLTTSHKANFSIEQWKDIFSKRGIAITDLKALPANAGNLSRKDEIVKWFSVNSNEMDFVIIDDDTSLRDLPAKLKERLVLTSPLIGLTDRDREAVDAIKKKLQIA